MSGPFVPGSCNETVLRQPCRHRFPAAMQTLPLWRSEQQPVILAELQVEKQRLADQAPDSDVIAFLTASTAAPAASTAGRGATAAAAGVAATQQRTAADADAAMAALLVGAPTMHITALVSSFATQLCGAPYATCHGMYASACPAQLPSRLPSQFSVLQMLYPQPARLSVEPACTGMASASHSYMLKCTCHHSL
jgi:hypothetical protein